MLKRRESIDNWELLETDEKNHSAHHLFEKLNHSLTRKANPVKFGIMSPSMVQGFVSPLDSITKIRHSAHEPIEKKSRPVSNTSKIVQLSPVHKMADDNEDARSHKHKQTERLENENLRHHLDDSIDEELLKTQHMSELSLLEEEAAEEWDKMIGILVLLLTLLGHASMGVAANIVPASSGFVQMAQRSGFVLMVSAVPAYFEHQYFEDNIDWKELFSCRSLSYSMFTNALLMLWHATFFDGA